MLVKSRLPQNAATSLQGQRCVRCGHVSVGRTDPKIHIGTGTPACERCGGPTQPVNVTLHPDGPPDETPAAPAATLTPAAKTFAETVGMATTAPFAPEPQATAPSAHLARSSSRLPGLFLIWSELWSARSTSRRLLSLYNSVRDEQPYLAGRALYEEVVVRWTQLDRMAARSVLRRAEQSFSDWASERDLEFQDVVFYIVIDGYMQAHPDRHGSRAAMQGTVARIVPRNL